MHREADREKPRYRERERDRDRETTTHDLTLGRKQHNDEINQVK